MFQWGGGGVFQMGDFIFKGWGAGGIGFGEGGGLKKILRCGAPSPTMGNPASDDQKRLLASFDRFMWQSMP